MCQCMDDWPNKVNVIGSMQDIESFELSNKLDKVLMGVDPTYTSNKFTVRLPKLVRQYSVE
ncbi:hypothetical protein L208DRAFT_1406722 [Tricholoma matsutake]|nr:hypothetical protein L208DRAFT_1406722 [Tricholoma matsutake 945]